MGGQLAPDASQHRGHPESARFIHHGRPLGGSPGLGTAQSPRRPGVPASLGLLATLLLRGFISWGTHLLNHKVPVLWRFHRVHHLDTELDVSSTVRFHPIEFVLSLIMGLPLVVVFGLTPWALVLYEVLDAAVTLFSHSNLRVPASIDRVLKYIIVTPDLHRIHHSSWQPETDSNYSAVFPVWDLLMGTFRGSPREAHATMILGLDEVRDRRSRQALWLLTSPFRRHFPGDPERELSPASMNA